MIFDVPKLSAQSASVLIPVEALKTNAGGSRMPEIVGSRLTPSIAQRLADVCPTGAITVDDSRRRLTLDYGECTGCGDCIAAGEGAVAAAASIAQCGVARAALLRRWDLESGAEVTGNDEGMRAAADELRALLGGALNVREVDAGSCNGCEQEIIATTSPYYDLERFGVHFVASPKHADMLLVTGPVTRNMAEALRQTYEVTPSPKLVVAVGACAISGGVFSGSYAVEGPVERIIPVDACIPGCPPTPAMLLSGILRAVRDSSRKR